MSKVNVTKEASRAEKLGFFTLKEVKGQLYLVKVEYDNVKKTQRWESMGNVEGIKPGDKKYKHLKEAKITYNSQHAKSIIKEYFDGKIDADKAISEFKKLLEK